MSRRDCALFGAFVRTCLWIRQGVVKGGPDRDGRYAVRLFDGRVFSFKPANLDLVQLQQHKEHKRRAAKIQAEKGLWFQHERQLLLQDGPFRTALTLNAVPLALWPLSVMINRPGYWYLAFSCNLDGLMKGRAHTFITKMFAHTGLAHFKGNMAFLFLYSKYFLANSTETDFWSVYLGGGLASSVFEMATNVKRARDMQTPNGRVKLETRIAKQLENQDNLIRELTKHNKSRSCACRS